MFIQKQIVYAGNQSQNVMSGQATINQTAKERKL